MNYRNLTDHELGLMLNYAAQTEAIDPDLVREAAARIDPEAEEQERTNRDARYKKLIAAGSKIEAIKEYRQSVVPMLSLKDAKDYIDQLEDSMRSNVHVDDLEDSLSPQTYD